MRARVRSVVKKPFFSGHRRRAITLLGLLALIAVGFVANAVSSGAATTNGDPITWSQTECIAQVGGGTLGTPIDITVDAVVPNTATLNQAYNTTTPGGTTTLPSASNGFNISGFQNLNQTYLFRGSAGSPLITSATPQGPAVNNGNNVAYNATFTNEGTSTALT